MRQPLEPGELLSGEPRRLAPVKNRADDVRREVGKPQEDAEVAERVAVLGGQLRDRGALRGLDRLARGVRATDQLDQRWIVRRSPANILPRDTSTWSSGW